MCRTQSIHNNHHNNKKWIFVTLIFVAFPFDIPQHQYTRTHTRPDTREITKTTKHWRMNWNWDLSYFFSTIFLLGILFHFLSHFLQDGNIFILYSVCWLVYNVSKLEISFFFQCFFDETYLYTNYVDQIQIKYYWKREFFFVGLGLNVVIVIGF